MQLWQVVGVAVVVLVIVALIAASRVRALNRPQPPAPIAPGTVTNLPESDLSDVRALAAEGNKIAAIKELRERTGVGLAEAKSVVDGMAAGRIGPDARARRAPGNGRAPGRAQPLPAATRERARALIADGKPIAAIKAVREDTGMGLRDAKDTVDALATAPHAPHAPPTPHAPAAARAGGDLASRVRDLRADDRTGEAIELVAAETGMSLVDATRFVESVSP